MKINNISINYYFFAISTGIRLHQYIFTNCSYQGFDFFDFEDFFKGKNRVNNSIHDRDDSFSDKI